MGFGVGGRSEITARLVVQGFDIRPQPPHEIYGQSPLVDDSIMISIKAH